MNLTQFRTRFPEFDGVADTIIEATLAEALLRLNVTIYGKRIDEAQGYLTAHKLALSPYGQAARLATEDGKTTYAVHFKEMQRELTYGFRVVGDQSINNPGAINFWPWLS